MNVCSAGADVNPSLNPTRWLIVKNLPQSVRGLLLSHLLQITVGTSYLHACMTWLFWQVISQMRVVWLHLQLLQQDTVGNQVK